MEKRKKYSVPRKEDYIVKYIFKEDSNVDINEAIKESFISQIRANNIQKNHFTIL